MKYNGQEWSAPEVADFSGEYSDADPFITADGRYLYFVSKRPIDNLQTPKTDWDIWRMEKIDGEWTNPERLEPSVKLSETINEFWEGDLYISPNEDYMIFRSYGRPAGNGLYITCRSGGEWSTPQYMGKDINKTGDELCPMVDPDGKFFFFSSRHIIANEESGENLTYQKIKNDFANSYKYPGLGRTDIYWVSTDIIESFRLNIK